MRTPQSAGYTTLGAIAFLASVGITQWGNADTPKAAWHWTAPISGTEVVYYQGEVRMVSLLGDTSVIFTDSTPATPDSVLPRYEMDYQWGISVELRVAGIDSAGRQGPFSEWSDPLVDHGPPGKPFRPMYYLNMSE